MSRPALLLVAIAGLYGAIGVATAAMAAHGKADPLLGTASNFLLLHAAALLGAGAAVQSFGGAKTILIPAFGLALGTFLFCGDLLVRVEMGASPLPIIAPIGGTLLIASWLALGLGAALAAIRKA